MCSHHITRRAGLPEGDGGCRKLCLGQSLIYDVPHKTGQQTGGSGHLFGFIFVFTPGISFRPFLKCLPQRLMTWTCTSSTMSRTISLKWRSTWWMGNRKRCSSIGKVPPEHSHRTTHSSRLTTRYTSGHTHTTSFNLGSCLINGISSPADRPASTNRGNHGNLQLCSNRDRTRHDWDIWNHMPRGGTTPDTYLYHVTQSIIMNF